MLNPDFTDRTYTAEVLKMRSDAGEALDSIAKLTTHPETITETTETDATPIRLCHGFIPSPNAYHRSPRVIRTRDREITIPRRKKVGKETLYFYDVLIAHCRKHVVVAVPFHDLAAKFFPEIDKALGGTGMRYEKLDITAMVIRLGAPGTTALTTQPGPNGTALSVTRCHLAYADQLGRTSNLQQIRLTGANLGASDQYGTLIAPVLNPSGSALTVTPLILGFALISEGVRKSSATTDRHGNFKLWIAPGLRRLIRLFHLLSTLEEMKNVVSTTTNVPIMQSKAIREAEEQGA